WTVAACSGSVRPFPSCMSTFGRSITYSPHRLEHRCGSKRASADVHVTRRIGPSFRTFQQSTRWCRAVSHAWRPAIGRFTIMTMQPESLEVLEKADVPPVQARAIVCAIEIDIAGATDTLATKHDLLFL